LQAGGAAPTVFNAANEVAVAEFLAGRISFPAITALVDATLDAATGRGLLAELPNIDAALAVDHNARSLALALLPEIAVKSS
jgi:1-deoxy-D-xylulose-5-phosphate reductoisomerase